MTFSRLIYGDNIITVDYLFLGTNRYFSRVAATQMGIEISFVDVTDLDKLKSAIKPNTKVWIPCFSILLKYRLHSVCKAWTLDFALSTCLWIENVR